MVSMLFFEKAPLKYPLMRSLSVLDQRVILMSKAVSTRKLTTVLVETGRVEEKCFDEILSGFAHVCDHNPMSASDPFGSSKPESGSLDEFHHE